MSNIKLTPDNRIKLLDFGLARDTQSLTLTRVGNVAGTMLYLSPERIVGGLANARSDVWSLGILFHAMLIGQLPFQANDTTGLWEHLKSKGYPGLRAFNPDMPEWCDALVSRCLRLRPPRRFQNGGEIASHLDVVLAPARPIAAALWPKIRVAFRTLLASTRVWWRILLPVCVAPVILALYLSDAALVSQSEIRLTTLQPASAQPSFDGVSHSSDALETLFVQTATYTARKPSLVEVRIGSAGGPLEVYCAGRLIGVATAQPVVFTAEVGTALSLRLRRGNEMDLTVPLTVAELGNSYDY